MIVCAVGKLVEFAAAAAAAALAWRKNEASLKATIVLCESELGNRCNVWFGMMGSSRFSWSFQSHRTGTAQCQSLRGRSDDGLILTYTRPDLDTPVVKLVPIVAVPEGILLASAKVGAVTSSHSITRRRRPQLRLPIKTPLSDWYVTSALVGPVQVFRYPER
ncbi:hypothetical protein CMEL01_15296 [Colletotrichum melonis]|uniref:Uncharacterized protein n=1 Tax=Colletotrichum melonis TaxID=1209925 RepID=A0AAI9URY0_9PEZI|nr:hypothetical protein CMEL01_15296 [Colletotrichum melonis]